MKGNMEEVKPTAAESLSRFVKLENESSKRQQLQCFFGYLLVGQWELARATARQICQNPFEEDGKHVLEALLDVASNPYGQSDCLSSDRQLLNKADTEGGCTRILCLAFNDNESVGTTSVGSRSVVSPEHLAWLALKEYEHCARLDSQVVDIAALKRDVEFRLLLVHECEGVDDSTLKAVYQYFQKHHGAGQAYSQLAAFDSRETLPKKVESFIRQKLQDQPVTGHHLITFLMPKKRMTDNRESEALQNLYIETMKTLLDSLPTNGDKRGEVCDKVFQLLSLYDPESYWNYLQIRQLFTHLLSLSKEDSSNFNLEKIMEALMGRTQSYLIDEFGKMLQELCVTDMTDMPACLSEQQKQTLLLLTGKDRDVCWQRFFVTCLKWNKHCLGVVMETCISLVMAEQFDTLGQFLSAPELRRMQPVVLLACWTYCRSSDSARRLLDTLWTSSGAGIHPVLSAGCKKLAYQLSLIKWCLERARPLLENSESASSQPSYGERATKLLHGLETHSVLYVLHQSTQLAILDSQEVLRLLQNVARGNEDRERKKQKSVHFQDDSQSQNKEPINAEQEHDICIYRSYCAIKSVMDAIVFCFENSNLDLMNPVKIENAFKPKQLSRAVEMDPHTSVSSSEGDDESSTTTDRLSGDGMRQKSDMTLKVSGTSFKETYHRHVWQRIQQAREHLQHIYPLTYRVEILENIFSLLFCRHSDVQDITVMTEEVSDDDAERESKADSMENLSMSIVSEEDVDLDKLSSVNSKESASTSSSFPQQTDSAIGSLGPEEKNQRSDSIEYDIPFPEQKPQRVSYHKQSRFKDLDSSDNVRLFSQSNIPYGFLANDYVVRDILAMLKDALVDLNAVKYKKMGQMQSETKSVVGTSKQSPDSSRTTPVRESPSENYGSGRISREVSRSESPTADKVNKTAGLAEVEFNPALEKLLSQTVSTSVTPETVQKRAAQLGQHVHEAHWRFQLVAHEQIPRQAGKVLEEVVMVKNDENYAACVSDEWMSQRSQSAEGVHGQSEKSGRRRSVSNVMTTGLGSLHPSQQSIIARMLSSPDSLLTMSLTKSNFAQASQIIKMLKISEKTREAAEVAFTETFNSTAKSLTSLTASSKEAQRVSSPKKFSLQAVKTAAATAVANTTLSKFVDDLLGNPNIPLLPRPHWVSEHGQDSIFGKFFQISTKTAILMDLACTMCQSWELCHNVFEIIKAKGNLGKLPSAMEEEDGGNVGPTDVPSTKDKKKGKNAFTDCDVKGNQGFFHQLHALLQVGHEDLGHWTVSAMQEVSAIAGGSATAGKVPPAVVAPPPTIHTPVTVQQSLIQRFREISSPLTASGVKLYENSVHDIQVSFEQANQALLASSRLDRQESFHIDETHFQKSPVKQTTMSFSPATSRTSSLGSGGSSWSREAQGRIERPILHQRMKHLIATMEKNVPLEGLTYVLIHGEMERGIQRNYLLSTYEHVKELAYVVAECESKSAETLILPKNYFSILQEGPVDILGRLMFVKRVSPAKLEKVASKLSLNLTHIIVQSCCPQIPSKHLPAVPSPCPDAVEKVGARFVYNGSHHENTRKTSDPDMLVRNILQDILNAMQEVAVKYNGKGIFTELCGKYLVKGEGYRNMVTNIKSLQTVNLDTLDSREKRLCFFANLLNLMTIHYHLNIIEQCTRVEELRAGRRDEGFSWGLKGLDGQHMLDMITKLGAFCYRVGQLGVLSLFDLKYVMLYHGQKLNHKWKSLVTSGAQKLAPDDPLYVYMPPAEPRLLFVVSDGCLSSPPVQVLEWDKLSSQLDTAAKSYLMHTVRLEPEAGQISVPLLLTTLCLDKPGKKYNSKTMYENLLNFVSINASASQARMLDQMTSTEEARDPKGQETTSSTRKKSPPEVTMSDFTTSFAYVFKMEDLAVEEIQLDPAPEATASPKLAGSHHTGGQSSASSSPSGASPFLPHHFMLESTGSQMDIMTKISMTEPASYQLTPVTLDYVRETSGLVATLLTLLCSDELDDIESQFTDDHFYSAGLPRHRASSDISVVDIRSYRYHRLVDDFPILQRHLLTYIVPLAGADNPEISHSKEPILKFVTNVIDEDVKMCLFSLHNSLQFLDMLHTMTSRLIGKRQWQGLVPVLRSIPEVVMDTYPHLQLLHDFVISCWAREFSATLPKAKPSAIGKAASKINLLHQLRKMYCPDTQARAVIAVCDKLPVDWGLDLLDLCLSQSIQSQLCIAVQAKHHHLSIYHKITSCLKTYRIQLSMQQPDIALSAASALSPAISEQLQKLVKYEDWRYTSRMSQEDPKEVMSVLVEAGDIVLARDWAKLHQLPNDMMMDIEVLYMMSLMTTNGSDTLPVFRALEDLRVVRPAECLEVCQHLLEKLKDQHKVKFITGYMLKHLTANLPQDELEDLRLRQIGAKALMCIPKSIRGEYAHLVTCPHLILEQLLMNMKGELAGRVFENIRDDFSQIKESKLSVAQDQFNSLLTDYARKALEVTVVQTLNSPTVSSAMGSPRPTSTGSGSSKDEGGSGSTQRHHSETAKVRMRNMDTAAVSSGPLPPTTIQRRGSTLSTTTPVGVPSSSTTASRSGSTKFIMPVIAPAEDQWTPDNEASVCMVCKLERFSMFNRRHHCRRCGRVVCAACSTKRSQVRGVSARTCDECYEQMFGTRESRARDEQEVYSQRMKESLSGASPSLHSSSLGHLATQFRPTDHLNSRSLSSVVHHHVHEWKLKTDEGLNSYVRDEFFYEQAPSVALCMSILQHHSDSHVSGELILTMCDDLSTFLQPLAPGVPNLEVDYGLIISIIRELLFRAKMIFLKGGDSSVIAKCDAYQTRVDLLKILLEANYPDLPTLQELSKMDSARRLRDKLMKDERLALALEVCTKCGLESQGVWLAWGRACLQCGDLGAARDKFAHCLKVPKDKNQTGVSSRLLMEIIDLLESLPPTGVTEIQMLLSDPASISSLISMPMPMQQDETSVESIVYKECIYYLRTYGTYSDHLKFLLRNGYWSKAVKFVIDRRCSPEVFVESILQPVLQAGEMTRLLEQLLMHDTSLDQWMPHLTASCRYLLRSKHFHVLYNIQIFMKDYLRAAMTCITHFYQHGAQSYLDLANRLQFLFIAQEHMQSFLDPMKWGAVRHPSVSSLTPPSPLGDGASHQAVAQTAAQLCMSKEDVTRNLRIIALQIEVTQFLKHCLQGGRTGEAAAVATQFVAKAKATTVIPTLFGNQEQRKDVVKMILLSGGKLVGAFDLSVRIFHEVQLKGIMVLKSVVCEQLKQRRLPEMLDLLRMMEQRKVLDDDEWDEIVSTALLEITEKQVEARDETEILIKMIRKEHNKLNALIMTGKLRSAYLTAAKTNRAQDISRIMAAAERMGQAAVRNICKKWLEQHQNH